MKYNIAKNATFLGLFILLIITSGCDRVQEVALPTTQTAPARISMVYPEKCLGDMAYCDQLQKGVKAAETELGIDITEVESGEGLWETHLREAAQRSGLVITAGYQLAGPIQRVAPAFPDVNFVLIDTHVDMPNVTSVTYKEQEGSFLVGAIAAHKTETGKVGYIGAVDVPLLRKYEAGYVAGVHAINPAIEIVREYIAEDSSGFSNVAEANRLAVRQYESGVDIIYTVAAGAGQGAVDAAKVHQKYIIWVDDNINATAPDIFLTSMVKRVGRTVYDVAIQFAAGALSSGPVALGLEVGTESSVDYALDEHNRPHLSDEILTQVEALRTQIISGEIVVPHEIVLPRE